MQKEKKEKEKKFDVQIQRKKPHRDIEHERKGNVALSSNGWRSMRQAT
jgi:hypothetical protein